MAGLPHRYINDGVTFRRCRIHRGDNLRNLPLHGPPSIPAENYIDDLPALEILLVRKTVASGERQLKTSLLGNPREELIRQCGPSLPAVLF